MQLYMFIWRGRVKNLANLFVVFITIKQVKSIKDMFFHLLLNGCRLDKRENNLLQYCWFCVEFNNTKERIMTEEKLVLSILGEGESIQVFKTLTNPHGSFILKTTTRQEHFKTFVQAFKQIDKDNP